jgi:hypothetical protein
MHADSIARHSVPKGAILVPSGCKHGCIGACRRVLLVHKTLHVACIDGTRGSNRLQPRLYHSAVKCSIALDKLAASIRKGNMV